MSAAFKSSGRGTWIIEKRIKGLGLLRRASGTRDLNKLKAYKAMIVTLIDQGRLDILRAIKDKRLSFAEAYEVYTKQAHLPGPEDMAWFFPAFDEWRKRMSRKFSQKHVMALYTTKNALGGAVALRVERRPRIGDLPTMLEALRDRALEIGQGERAFNLTRHHVMAFLRDTLKPKWLTSSRLNAHGNARACSSVLTSCVSSPRS